MEKVVFITGASSGIGKDTAKLFQVKNWKVAATMRAPENADDLQRIADIECYRLDVTDPETIRSAIEGTFKKFGRIDAVVNNAGYALVGPFEAASDDQIRQQFDTNVFGLMSVCREILPVFRKQKRGVIVNVSSMGGRITFPLYSVYHATKWAVEGFSESLQYEVKRFGIKVKIIEPGPIRTDFYDRSQTLTHKEGLPVYDSFVEQAMPNLQKAGESAPEGAIVAQTIYDAVTDDSWKMRYPVNSRGILAARRLLPDAAFFALVRKAVLK